MPAGAVRSLVHLMPQHQTSKRNVVSKKKQCNPGRNVLAAGGHLLEGGDLLVLEVLGPVEGR